MKTAYFLTFFAGLFLMTACGSGNSNVVPVIGASTGAPTIGTTTGPTGCIYGASNVCTQAIPNGTETVTTVLSGYITFSSSYSFPIPQITVDALDQIFVSAQSATVQNIGGNINTNSYLNNLSVTVNGTQLGNSLYSLYTVTTGGTLTLGADWPVANSSGTHIVSFNGGGVQVFHCADTSNNTIACPASYY